MVKTEKFYHTSYAQNKFSKFGPPEAIIMASYGAENCIYLEIFRDDTHFKKYKLYLCLIL